MHMLQPRGKHAPQTRTPLVVPCLAPDLDGQREQVWHEDGCAQPAVPVDCCRWQREHRQDEARQRGQNLCMRTELHRLKCKAPAASSRHIR